MHREILRDATCTRCECRRLSGADGGDRSVDRARRGSCLLMTVAGTVRAPSLLDKPTATPPLVAAPFSVTVQFSFPAPVIEVLPQTSPLSTGAAGALGALELAFNCRE